MTENKYTPATDRVRAAYKDERHRMGPMLGSESTAEFDRWLLSVRAETAATIVAKVRMSCTPSAEAYSRGGDFLVSAVADWIESPPEWVEAEWVVEEPSSSYTEKGDTRG